MVVRGTEASNLTKFHSHTIKGSNLNERYTFIRGTLNLDKSLTNLRKVDNLLEISLPARTPLHSNLPISSLHISINLLLLQTPS